jgi:hypothetical protein
MVCFSQRVPSKKRLLTSTFAVLTALRQKEGRKGFCRASKGL